MSENFFASAARGTAASSGFHSQLRNVGGSTEPRLQRREGSSTASSRSITSSSIVNFARQFLGGGPLFPDVTSDDDRSFSSANTSLAEVERQLSEPSSLRNVGDFTVEADLREELLRAPVSGVPGFVSPTPIKKFESAAPNSQGDRAALNALIAQAQQALASLPPEETTPQPSPSSAGVVGVTDGGGGGDNYDAFEMDSFVAGGNSVASASPAPWIPVKSKGTKRSTLTESTAASSTVHSPSNFSPAPHSRGGGGSVAGSFLTHGSGALLDPTYSGNAAGLHFLTPEAVDAGNVFSGEVVPESFGVIISKLDRLKAGDVGYPEQVQLLTYGGGVKRDEKFGLPAWAATSGVAGNDPAGTSALERDQSNRDKLKKVDSHVVRYDLGAKVPRLKAGVDMTMSDADLRIAHPGDLFQLNGEAVNLLDPNAWHLLNVETIRLFQKTLNLNSLFSPADKENSRYLSLVIRAFMNSDLQAVVDDEFERSFKRDERGGYSYIYTFMFTIFKDSSVLTDSIKANIVKFSEIGPRIVDGENIRRLADELTQQVMYLERLNELRPEMVDQLLDGLSKSTCVRFQQHFLSASYAEKDKQLRDRISIKGIGSGVTSQASIREKIVELLGTATVLYSAYNANGQWRDAKNRDLKFHTASRSASSSSSTLKCFNCGGPHHLKNCPVKRDEVKIKANVDAYNNKRKSGNFGGGSGKGSNTPKSEIPTRDSGNESGGSGTRKSQLRNYKVVNGTLMWRCNTCAKSGAPEWGNHGTNHHAKAMSTPGFCMETAVPDHSAFKNSRAQQGSTQGPSKAWGDHSKKLKELEAKLAAAGGSSTAAGAPIFNAMLRLSEQFAKQHFQ